MPSSKTRRHFWWPALGLILLFQGCRGNTQSFAGFTYGGGGKTFSCEPARWSTHSGTFTLEAGLAGTPTTIILRGGPPLKMGESLPLSEASFTVPGYEGKSSLVSGHLVWQSQRGEFVDGSFELKVRTSDGRELPVVGSFTADQTP